MIHKHELIGLPVSITDAKNASLIGLQGTIIDETKQSFLIETNVGVKRVLKQGVRFVVQKAGEEYIIDGSLLTKRPHERIKKS